MSHRKRYPFYPQRSSFGHKPLETRQQREHKTPTSTLYSGTGEAEEKINTTPSTTTITTNSGNNNTNSGNNNTNSGNLFHIEGSNNQVFNITIIQLPDTDSPCLNYRDLGEGKTVNIDVPNESITTDELKARIMEAMKLKISDIVVGTTNPLHKLFTPQKDPLQFKNNNILFRKVGESARPLLWDERDELWKVVSSLKKKISSFTKLHSHAPVAIVWCDTNIVIDFSENRGDDNSYLEALEFFKSNLGLCFWAATPQIITEFEKYSQNKSVPWPLWIKKFGTYPLLLETRFQWILEKINQKFNIADCKGDLKIYLEAAMIVAATELPIDSYILSHNFHFLQTPGLLSSLHELKGIKIPIVRAEELLLLLKAAKLKLLLERNFEERQREFPEIYFQNMTPNKKRRIV